MNWLSWLPPKNSFIAATTGRMLMRALGVALSISWIVIRSRTTRSMPEEADPERVLDQLAVGPDAAVAEVVDVVLLAEPAVELDEVADDRGDVLLVIVRPSRRSSRPIRPATASSFLLNL
jgi:hypothetical protein